MTNTKSAGHDDCNDKSEVSAIEDAAKNRQHETVGKHILDEERELTLWQSAVRFKRILLFATASLFAGGVFGCC